MDIEMWLKDFRAKWKNKDVAGVLQLFAQDVEYWETPYKMLRSFDVIKSEWQVIIYQSDIRIDTNVFSSVNNRHSIRWNLNYKDSAGKVQTWAGTYLIKLDNAGKCTYFYQTGEKLA